MKTNYCLVLCFCLLAMVLTTGCGKETNTISEPFTDEMKAEMEAVETANADADPV